MGDTHLVDEFEFMGPEQANHGPKAEALRCRVAHLAMNSVALLSLGKFVSAAVGAGSLLQQ